jgi:hypothetical protein
MAVALTSDPGVELNLANGNAYALLEGLGLRPDSVGELPIDAVCERLANPAVRQNAAEHGVSLSRRPRSAPRDGPRRRQLPTGMGLTRPCRPPGNGMSHRAAAHL